MVLSYLQRGRGMFGEGQQLGRVEQIPYLNSCRLCITEKKIYNQFQPLGVFHLPGWFCGVRSLGTPAQCRPLLCASIEHSTSQEPTSSPMSLTYLLLIIIFAVLKMEPEPSTCYAMGSPIPHLHFGEKASGLREVK